MIHYKNTEIELIIDQNVEMEYVYSSTKDRNKVPIHQGLMEIISTQAQPYLKMSTGANGFFILDGEGDH